MMMSYLILGLFKPFHVNVDMTSLFTNDTMESILVSAASILITLGFNVIIGTLLAFQAA